LIIAISTSSFACVDRTPLDLLKSHGLKVKPNPYGRKLTETEIIAHLNGVDGLLAGLEPLNYTVLTKANQLKAIARVGIGMENIDLQAANELGIKVSNTPVGPTLAVTEMTITAMLTLSRKIISFNKTLHQKRWEKAIGKGLKGTKILLIGYGRIGQEVANLLHAFSADILVYEPNINQSKLKNDEQLVDLYTGLNTAEIISLHASGNEPILTNKEFELMQDGVIILNSARGKLIDETALIQALESGKVSAAWLDVFQEEPYKGRLTEFDQVLLTPHISTYTQQCRRDMELSAVKNLLRDLEII